MKRVVFALVLILFSLIAAGRADLAYPALFKMVEQEADLFHITITVPLIQGRYVNVKPIVPEAFQPEEEPLTTAGTASLTRSWRVRAERESLYGEFLGLDGLLGTSTEVRFLLATLDGRRIETVFRPTQSIFMVPEPEAVGSLSFRAAREGMRRAIRSFGLWAGLACILLSARSTRIKIGGVVALAVGFLGVWSLSMGMTGDGLSDSESKLMAAFFLVGCAGGLSAVLAALGLAGSLITAPVRSRAWICSWVLVSAWAVYQAAGLFFHHGSGWLAGLDRHIGTLAHHWFSPFAADWAMGKLRIPLLSIVALALFVSAVFKVRHRAIRITVSAGLLLFGLILLPYGVAKGRLPFITPGAPSAKQARLIIEPMLSEIYGALNLEDEEQTYDELSEQVSGNLITDLYLDSRRRLAAGTREGASVTVKQVQVESVESLPSGSAFHTYQCSWTVQAKVIHWLHTHERSNRYEGDLGLVIEAGSWKLAAINLLSEERTIVPGSFSSR